MRPRALRRAVLIALSVGGLAPDAMAAQRAAPGAAMTPARFVAQAREGTRRYRSQEAAIADGFKRVGVEFPAMGEHWVSLQRVMEDSLVPTRPAVLIYVNVDGAPRLAGVAYTALLHGGEQPPAFPSADAWHEHNGLVEEESLPLGHHATPAPAAPAGEDAAPRFSILHAWVWTPNPDGVFVTDNRSLPLVRLGVAPPAAGRAADSRDAVNALALATDVEAYHLLMLRTSLGLSAPEEAAAARVLADHGGRAAREVGAVRRARRLTAPDSARLAALWGALWVDLERALPGRASELRALRRQL